MAGTFLKSFFIIVSALISAQYEKFLEDLLKPLESRYWSAVTQDILKVAVIKKHEGLEW